MYVVVLNYIAPLAEIDKVLPDHAAWLSKNYDAGNFLAAGRRQPRTGGVIIVRTMPRAELDALIADDPIGQLGLTSYDVIEFLATTTGPELVAHQQSLG